MLQETRSRLHLDLANLELAELDATLPWAPNSVGTLLYHIAAIELDWTYADLLLEDFPEAAFEWFPADVRDNDGVLSPVVDTLDHHFERLAWVRGLLLEALRSISDDTLDESRHEGTGAVGVGWILHHLMQHEAEHRGQIGELRAALA